MMRNVLEHDSFFGDVTIAYNPSIIRIALRTMPLTNSILTLVAFALFTTAHASRPILAAEETSQDDRPNVVLVMLDDAGWTDFGCYGSDIETPNIDRFAESGIRFTDCHAAAPNCSPSRTGLLTGRIPSRTGVYSYIPPNHEMHLRDEEITIAELLKPLGYATGHFGKWHLSSLENEAQPQPADQGFDYSLGTTNNAQPSHLNPTNFVRNGEAIELIEGYSCHIVTDEFIRWLDAVPDDQPFFACVWYHEPHAKIASPPELIRKYQEKYPNISVAQARYFANIENVDLAFARLIAKLDDANRDENTFLFLTSDNGGVNSWSNQGLRGRKSFVYEGGHREPGILRWPGRATAGRVDPTPISHLDILPTICDITGATQPTDRKYDGTSLLTLLKGEQLRRQEPLFWYFYRVAPAAALRDGDWIILGYLDDPIEKHTHWLSSQDMPMIKSAQLGKFELYDLARDPQQQHDLSESEAERLESMRKQLVEKHREVVAEGFEWQLPR